MANKRWSPSDIMPAGSIAEPLKIPKPRPRKHLVRVGAAVDKKRVRALGKFTARELIVALSLRAQDGDMEAGAAFRVRLAEDAGFQVCTSCLWYMPLTEFATTRSAGRLYVSPVCKVCRADERTKQRNHVPDTR